MLKKLIISSFSLLFLTFLVPPAQSAMPQVLKKRIGVPPFKVLREVLTTANAGKTGKEVSMPHGGETPYLTWLADSDPRLSAASILPNGNRMITVRNPGGQLAISPGSLGYGILQLHTPVLLITGVADSRHVLFYLQGYNGVDRSLQMDLDHLHPALHREAAITLQEENPSDKLLRLVEANVDYQVNLAMSQYEGRIADGRLVVIGSVFDTSDHYGRGRNRLIITNVNGKKEKNLQETRLIRQLKPELRQYVRGN